jgi:hypothetical protein
VLLLSREGRLAVLPRCPLSREKSRLVQPGGIVIMRFTTVGELCARVPRQTLMNCSDIFPADTRRSRPSCRPARGRPADRNPMRLAMPREDSPGRLVRVCIPALAVAPDRHSGRYGRAGPSVCSQDPRRNLPRSPSMMRQGSERFVLLPSARDRARSRLPYDGIAIPASGRDTEPSVTVSRLPTVSRPNNSGTQAPTPTTTSNVPKNTSAEAV